MPMYEHEIVKPVGQLSIWYHIFDDNQAWNAYIPAHWHRGIELSYIERGLINDFRIGDDHFSSSSGRILIVNTQEIHSIKTQVKQNDLALSIIYPYSYVEGLFPKINNYRIEINHPENFTELQKLAYLNLKSQLIQFIATAQLNSNDRNIRLSIISLEILDNLLNNFIQKRKQLPAKKEAVTQRLQEIVEYITTNLKQDLSLEIIANECHISREYLARFFKKNMAMTVAEYIRYRRAISARKDLLSKNATLTEIAIDNGFSGIRSMNRALQEFYHEDAKEIRKREQK
ncbi:AraC family transcriptional regulator [Lactobacillus mulieris]|uniref:AraC family transcriptional regulator n=1 Tax=Lactobacillus mulieris TaxID=2508708 RepID=UPI001432A990|nr:AraC family transcriptional regulator [Lactobacillus mulieris]MCF1783642.1 AraC family transcriptional regulator [Lactobacillus mulieris]MCW8104270.1 AraC family transcriptional regulator [Lactobacillus mulieris]MDK6803130.1 AraC family transcriptional regulator [Lactobacillus mulieris]MDK8382246.1 AraC family transcriptional regulator [Lactobacillus mulieris]MDT9620388.1 AraC family transcriptional regulator [Lactobacillus mulieris]